MEFQTLLQSPARPRAAGRAPGRLDPLLKHLKRGELTEMRQRYCRHGSQTALRDSQAAKTPTETARVTRTSGPRRRSLGKALKSSLDARPG